MKRIALLLVALTGCGREATPDPCEVAWGELAALRDAMAAEIGDEVHAPDHDRFLAVCTTLPEAARPCLSPTWALDHPECEAAMAEVPEVILQGLSLDAPAGPN